MCYKSYPSQRGVACETNVLHVRIQFYGQGYFICNKVYPCCGALRAQCALIVMTSPLELVNLVNPPVYYCARTHDVTYAASLSRDVTQPSRDVCKSRDVSQLSRDVSQLSRNVSQ